MAYRALYRKYRPLSFSDVLGQEHIVKILKNELKDGKIFHAYLFTGPRGTGKTSCAKILAKAVNCLNLNNGDACCECESCKRIEDGNNLDIVEMDAASNRGIDNIRDLKDQVSYQPANSKYRVYIIDEVHMLSTEAFNALLKTLEEPPKHIVFILATTEVHKLPATILSRCQRFDFKRISAENICERLKYVAKKENFNIDDNAAMLIASLADGGLRDALSMLDICVANSNNITEEDVRKSCAIAGNDYLIEFAYCVAKKQTGKALDLVDNLYKNSVDMQRLCKELVTHYRNLMVSKTIEDPKHLITCSVNELQRIKEQANSMNLEAIICGLNEFSSCLSNANGTVKREDVELSVVKLCAPELESSNEALLKRISELEILLQAKSSVNLQHEVKQKPKKTETEPTDTKNNTANKSAEVTGKAERVTNWNKILDRLSETSPLLVGVLTDSSAYIKDGALLIQCDNSQFLDMMKSSSSVYRDSLRNAAQAVLGVRYKIGPYREKVENSVTDPLSDMKNKLSELEVPEKI